jgi:hypothetical protein
MVCQLFLGGGVDEILTPSAGMFVTEQKSRERAVRLPFAKGLVHPSPERYGIVLGGNMAWRWHGMVS